MACCFKKGQSSEIFDIFNRCLKNNVDNTLKIPILLYFFMFAKCFKNGQVLKIIEDICPQVRQTAKPGKIQENTGTWPKSAQEPILELGACPAKKGMQIA